MTLLSFVIPCYRSELTIQSVVDEIIRTVAERPGYDYEIICVNDSSPDNVYGVLRRLAKENPKIKVIDFAKNMGKHAALLAGFHFVSGDYVVSLDDDMQSPTNELWRLIDPLEAGECDVVHSRFPVKKQAWWKNAGSKLNQWVSAVLIDQPKGLENRGNLSAYMRFVVDEIIKYPNPYPYLQGLVLRTTGNIKMVDMEERERGDNKKSGYTLKKSIALFVNGFTAFSVKPLRISTIIGMIVALLGFALGIIMIIEKLLDPGVLVGYTSTMVILLFMSGLILMSLGMLGEYVGRIYICINKSPQYIIRSTLNVNSAESLSRMESKV